jgi:hypothetical protein
MKKSLLFVSLMLIGICAQSQLTAPPFSVDATNRNTAYLSITGTANTETGYEITAEGNGVITTTTVAKTGSVTFTSVGNLMPSTYYSFRIRATDGVLFSGNSITLNGTTQVDFPPAPVLKNLTNCPSSVLLNWEVPNRAGDVETYLVERSTGGAYTNIGTKTPGERFSIDSDNLPGINVSYRVRAVNQTGVTTSNVVTFARKNYTAPPAPANVFSDPNNKSRTHLTIRWTNPDADYECGSNLNTGNFVLYKLYNETEYKLYEQTYPNANSVKIDGLKPKDVVDFLVFSYNEYTRFQSVRVGGRDTTFGPPIGPKGLIAKAYDDKLNDPAIDLEWKDENRDGDYYIIEVSSDSTKYTQLAKINDAFGTASPLIVYKHSPIEDGTKYFYRIKAGSNTDGESPYTYINGFGGVFKSYSQKPNAPIGLNAKLEAGKVTLTWRDDSSREQEQILEKSIDKGVTFKELAKLAKNVKTYSDAAAPTAGLTYFYKIKTKNPVGESGYSNIAEVGVPAAKVGSIIDESVSVYPNPTIDKVTIKVPSNLIGKSGTISLLNENNNSVFEKAITSYTEEISVSTEKYEQGMYKLVIKSDGFMETKKIYKK